jgi:thiosulfate dehydrogenase [quinone] large subunit
MPPYLTPGTPSDPWAWNRSRPAAVVEVMPRPKPVSPALALFPLRLFLAGTFVYAGIQKLSDAGFLHAGAPTYIGTQLRGFADGTPGRVLLEPALSHPEAAGVAVALLEIVIGMFVLLGFMTRLAAAAGLALNLLLFLTATWHTSPYFLGSDIVFVFAWLPLVLSGAEGQPTIHDVLARRSLGLRRARVRGREIALPQLQRSGTLSRRALLAHVLGVTGLLTAVAAAASTLARGSFQAVASARPHASAGVPKGTVDLGPVSGLAAGEALPYTDAGGRRAIVVRADDGELFALGATCTHAGCELAYRQGVLSCPCHSSTFDIRTGVPQRGPARAPLPTAEVTERDGHIEAGELRRHNA